MDFRFHLRIPQKIAAAGGYLSSVFQVRDLALRQVAPFSKRQVSQPQLLLPHPLEPLNLQSALCAHPPNLTVAALMNHDAENSLSLVLSQQPHLCRANRKAPDIPDTGQPLRGIFQRAGNRYVVLLRHLMARMSRGEKR